ncbi:hypothetical protein GGR26_003512 [Lewinella marina]|uniref:DUF748 domain-containing protein n=1 Tax=Neolewinella marina TaxID=438751 RepID=A0A2G0CCA8_9BACT|nr:hypothetical protein [Neolewinella marina]NJB87728.1 hypothetical protein [Neolewinella marina]PHK97595.1 hypothetical protein CGL56_14250 [Neolewinella marina]
MPQNLPHFRWWYLLLLLPVFLYLGARWYVGHRIEQAISQANSEGNTLAVGDYEYGLFPLHLQASGVTFHQQRETFRATGSLSELYLGGVRLFSLFGSDPIEVERIHVRGLDGAFHRTDAGGAADSSSFALEVSEVELDSIFLTLADETSGRRAVLSDLTLSLQAFQLPFQPTELRALQLAADSVAYHDDSTDTHLVAGGIGYGSSRESVRVAQLDFRRGDSTKVRADDLVFSGINSEDIDGVFTVDTLSVARLGGVARVPGNSGQQSQASGGGPALRIARLLLPRVDLAVGGRFGSLSYAGALTADALSYRDSFTVQRVGLEGDSLHYANGQGTTVHLSKLQLAQQELTIPLNADRLGITELSMEAFSLQTAGQTVTGKRLAYGSSSAELNAADLKFRSNRISGTTDELLVTGIDRRELLQGGTSTLERALIHGAWVSIGTADGGRYVVAAPEVTVDDIKVGDQFVLQRVQVANAQVERYASNGHRNMIGRGIYVDQRDITAPIRPSRFGGSKVRMAELRIISEELPLDYVFVKMAYDSRAGTLTLDSMQRHNRIASPEMFRREISKSWLEFGFDGLRLSGIRHDALVSGEMIYVDSLYAKDFRLRVVEDLSLDLPGNNDRPMPIEALRRIGPRIVLNGARFSSTDIAYGIVDSLLDPKTIHFNNGTVLLHHLDTQESETDSVRVSIDATFEKSTPLHAEFHLSRDSVARGYAARGELGQYDLSQINPLMRIAADAIIEQGIIEKLTYYSRMDGDTISGDMTLLYRDLNLKVVGSGAWIKNLLSGVVVKNDNSRGEDFRPGRIFHVHTRDKSFFNSYWKGLVSGMKSSAMSDIALPDELD